MNFAVLRIPQDDRFITRIYHYVEETTTLKSLVSTYLQEWMPHIPISKEFLEQFVYYKYTSDNNYEPIDPEQLKHGDKIFCCHKDDPILDGKLWRLKCKWTDSKDPDAEFYPEYTDDVNTFIGTELYDEETPSERIYYHIYWIKHERLYEDDHWGQLHSYAYTSCEPHQFIIEQSMDPNIIGELLQFSVED